MATSTSFISNTGETHKEVLLKLMKQSEKIIFAVGFLKQSGLNNVKEHLKEFCANKKNSSAFYIGMGLGETDPDTLQSLYNTIKSKANHKLILCTPDAGIFHPKIYVFIKGMRVTIVTGSSNLTQHGWVVNDEVSMVTETTVDSTEYKQLNDYLKQLYRQYYANNVGALIQRYKEDREKYLKKFSRVPPFRFRRKKGSISDVDMPRLRRYYESYQSSDEFIEPSDREAEYEQAKE